MTREHGEAWREAGQAHGRMQEFPRSRNSMCKGPEEHHRLASGGTASRPVQTREVAVLGGAVGARSGALGATEGTLC